jgi:hypothetical protein
MAQTTKAKFQGENKRFWLIKVCADVIFFISAQRLIK